MYRKFIASSLPLLVAACAALQKPTPTVNVPDKLKLPANETLAMIVPAKGVQIYQCRAKKGSSLRMGIRCTRGGSLRYQRKEDWQTLCGSALGIGRCHNCISGFRGS